MIKTNCVCNFHPFEVADRVSETQLQRGENSKKLIVFVIFTHLKLGVELMKIDKDVLYFCSHEIYY